MNTRFAAIAGTLLVGLSLFVTSMISNNLNNATLTRSSEAQTSSCEAEMNSKVYNTIRNTGNRCTIEGTGGLGFWYCQGKTPIRSPLSCPDGTVVPLEVGDACTCRSLRDWNTYFSDRCCRAGAPTSTPTTAPGQPTNTPVLPTNTSIPGRPTNTPTPTPECVDDKEFGCSDSKKCCRATEGTRCIKIDSVGFCLPPEPTSTTCINEAEYGCPSTRCCNSSNICVANYCVRPQATPTPLPTEVPSCYNKVCSSNSDCGSGMECANPRNPGASCTGLNCGRCVVDAQCPAIIGNESPEELAFKIECFCGRGGAKACFLACITDNDCSPSEILKCTPPDDGDPADCTERSKRQFGQCVCFAPYCPRYSQFATPANRLKIQNDSYLEALIKRGLDPFPGLRDFILQ